MDFLELFKTEQILLIKESDFLQILFQAKTYFRVLYISDFCCKKIFFPQAFSNNNDSLALKEDYIFFQGELEVFFSRLHSAKENIYVPVRVYV